MRWIFGLMVVAAVGFACAAPAIAQDSNPVITINPDGSFSVDHVTPPPSAPKQVKVKKESKPQSQPAPKQAAPKQEAPKPKRDPEPAADSVFEPLDPVMPEEKPEEKLDEKKAEPAPAPKPMPKKAAVSKPAKKPAPKIVKSVPAAAPAPVQERDIAPAPSGPVTADDARRIAIRVGPAASRVDVYPADFNGLKVFQVIFKTETGEEYILVDRATGEIVREKPKGKKKR